MARSTKEEALETRNRILDAAENVFHAQGVAQTSLAEVAQAADVTRGAIYWHFKNKSDLFDAMCERVRLPMESMMEAGAEEGEVDPLGKLRDTCVFVLHEAARNPHSRKVFDIIFHKCEFVEEADPIVIRQRECYLEGMANIERILRKAIDRQQLPADLDLRLAGVTLHAAMGGLLNNWLFAPDSFNLEENAEKLIDACFDTLRYAPSLRR
ncbi:TetR family transcriptional regulator [Noviherbaspirillum sp. UKPF54]|uniref:TetR family transcriptional regulator n=1 Tax=Noviherbaspirillum sp. UKPF54 TaxID=2601898 RepID=UPI0011B0FD60|nr:TetR family transcriptional regulator [Noviherbaspirillum sp. UKPF54]QDZ28835.1 TetR family transcriptional regulator [Noviherbaspirillum sp. UKPF54]